MVTPDPAVFSVPKHHHGGALCALLGLEGGLLKHPLVARYVAALIARPLLTKCATSGVLSFVQEVLTNHIAGVKFHTHKDAPAHKKILAKLKVDGTALKMGAYGFFVAAPLGHYLNLLMLKLFAGRTSRKAKFAQLVAQFFFVAPVNVFVYLLSMAIIGGAKSQTHIRAHIHRGFAKMLAFTWLVQPSALVIARKYIPLELWSPFFNLVNFSLGTFFLTKVKKIQVRQAEEDSRRKRDPGPSNYDSHTGSVYETIEIEKVY